MKNRSSKALTRVFYSMIALFVVLMTFFVMPGDKRRIIFIVYAVIALIFLVLGVVQIVLAVRSDHEKKIKVLLVLMGGSAGGVLVGSILHNVFYAFAELSSSFWLKSLFEVLHVGFFLLALIGCPLAFIVGAVWGGILLCRNPEVRESGPKRDGLVIVSKKRKKSRKKKR